MDADEPVVPAGESPVGGSYVSGGGIYLMSAYLIVLFSTLGYCLVGLWPSTPPLAITSVNPNSGPAKGGTDVNISGTGFTDGVQVSFGDVRATKVTRKTDNLLTATTPADNKVGLATIEIAAPSGEKTSLPNGFRFDSEEKAAGKETGSIGAPSTPAQAVPGNCEKSSLPLFAWACSLKNNVRLLLIVIVVGALGSLIHVLRSFYWYVGNRSLKTSWLLMYFLLPFSGAGLGLLFFLITRGISSSPPAGIQSSAEGYAALAALVGMFSQQALIKLKQIAESVFSAAEKGKDQATSSSAPTVTAIQPAQGAATGGTKVIISGSGLSSVSRVAFGGTPAAAMTVDNDTQITATVPAHDAGKVDVEVVTTTGKKSSASAAFTYV